MHSLPHFWESRPPWLGQDLGPCGFPGRERKGSTAIAALCSPARAGCWKDGSWGCLCAAALPASSLARPASALLQREGAVPASSAEAPRWLLALGDTCLSCCAAFTLAECFLQGGLNGGSMFGGGRVWNLEGRAREPVVLPPLLWLGKGGTRRRCVTVSTWLQNGGLSVRFHTDI